MNENSNPAISPKIPNILGDFDVTTGFEALSRIGLNSIFKF